MTLFYPIVGNVRMLTDCALDERLRPRSGGALGGIRLGSYAYFRFLRAMLAPRTINSEHTPKASATLYAAIYCRSSSA